ncbi:beta-ketoacyl-ACP synthase III [Paraburkholderia sp. BL21I4N1]|uniref:beta-ketoacyl-ACP synthase III n=1 Tax=Paraburkholderia sp. BL21I4N1 TaxID=1938801 RepID=UPI000CFC15B8|nr:beta-ketoacyl-ACP synthase III [Paraburkholderia sp. BL21I4N1]PQV50084.1 3-oxoacyl-[acyl-carrier-protein] synthase-3 [Paraburkholderia sp. BL21I4N1]
MTLHSRITGTGRCLPPRRLTNHDITEMLAQRGIETSDEWIVSRSGISARHYADADTMTSDLATRAAQQALEMAGLRADEIDLVIVATSTPDHLGGFPSTACIVQKKLGITNGGAAFDVSAVCSGFVYALSIADSLIRTGMHRNALVIGAEVFSRLLDFNDRSTCVLFGDGAGAFVLSASREPGIRSAKMQADGRQADILCIPGSLRNGALIDAPFLHMDGRTVFKLGIEVLEQVARDTLALASITVDELSWLIPHQANIRIIHGTAKRLRIPDERVLVTVDQHGNTSAASIPLAFDTGVRDGRIRAGQHVLMNAVGGGFTWGAVLATM